MKFVFLIFTLLLLGASTVVARSTTSPRPSQSQQPPPPVSLSRRRLLPLLAGFVAWGLGLATIVQTVEALYGPFWPLRPTVTPQALSAASPLDIPFSITNPSLFSYSNVRIACGIRRIETSVGNVVTAFSIEAQANPETLASGQTRPYTCPFTKFFRFEPGAIITKAQIDFKIEYIRSWWFFTNRSQHFWTNSFVLDTATQPESWQAGEPLE